MTDCWVNIMPPSAAHSLHLHPLSFMSGTYYVATPRRAAPGSSSRTRGSTASWRPRRGSRIAAEGQPDARDLPGKAGQPDPLRELAPARRRPEPRRRREDQHQLQLQLELDMPTETKMKTVLVTGASRGIGRAAAIQLAGAASEGGHPLPRVGFAGQVRPRRASRQGPRDLQGGHGRPGGRREALGRGDGAFRNRRRRRQQRGRARGPPSPRHGIRGLERGMGADPLGQPPRPGKPLAACGAGHGQAVRLRANREHLVARRVPRRARVAGVRRQQGRPQFLQPIARQGPGALRRPRLLHRSRLGRDRDGSRRPRGPRGARRSARSTRSGA
jgi:hypothetical protein